MKMRVFIEIEVKDEKACRAIELAVEPDNRTAPPGMLVKTECLGTVLRSYLEATKPPIEVLTVRNTVDDLLSHISIAWRVTSRVKTS